MRKPTPHFFVTSLVVLVGAFTLLHARTGQEPQANTKQTAAAATSPNAQTLAQGWTALGNGDYANAARLALLVLQSDPRNVGALSLAIEADIVGAGAAGGLSVYEQWLGNKRIEDAYVLRKVATAYLREAQRDPAARIEALKALATDGDAEAAAALAAGSSAGRFGEIAALASLGDPQSTRALIAQLSTAPNKLPIIEALSRTRSQEAVPPLMNLLDDPVDDVRAAAADALGKIGAVQATNTLRGILDDPKIVYTPLKWKTAAALCRLKDAACLTFFRRVMADPKATEYPQLKVDAAADMIPFGSDAEWIDQIRPLISHPDPQVREKAAVLIAPYDNASARVALQSLLQDPNPAIRELAARDLAGKVAGDFATLRALLRHADATTRTQAAARILELTR